jgi:hypothetical protein
MTALDFGSIVEEQIRSIRGMLGTKAAEYATTADRLHNFKEAAKLLRCTPAEACMGFAAKHVVSVVDIVKSSAAGQHSTQAVLDEKIGDAINYLILLKALLIEAA